MKEILISAFVLGFCFAWILRDDPSLAIYSFYTVFIITLISIGISFIAHELAHKYVAQRYGCWAEFRMWETGLTLAFLMAITMKFVFAAPGAVYISGGYFGISKKENGLISVAGPLTNLILALLFSPLLALPGFLGTLGYFGFFVNAWLAFFNLIPFPPLDGSKVLAWSPMVWAGVSLIAFIFMGMLPY
ncbi:MAG: site-2 protease family protein [Candidatus Hydrothermarchaeales archaeon]